DAELIPPLLDDEARGLVRSRGLVFLPGGRVLAYDPAAPLDLAALVQAPPVQRSTWASLPELPARADRLREVVLEVPPRSPDPELRPLAPGAPGGMSPPAGSAPPGEGARPDEPPAELPRPPAAGPVSSLAGRAQAGLGQGLMWLGRVFGWRG